MRQFSVCALKAGGPGRRERLVIVLQHDLLSDLRTRLVAPLLPKHEFRPVDRLTPEIALGSESYLIGLDQMAAVDTASLGPELDRIDAQDEVMIGIDLIFAGF